jgi:AAT family amino acid transporter/GABA permease/proline-specific permease ProY
MNGDNRDRARGSDTEISGEIAAVERRQQVPATARQGVLRRRLPWSLILIGLGGVIGSGIFVASGIPISAAGPSAVIAYILGAVVVVPVLLYTAEMEVVRPARGAFSDYAHEYLSPLMGFLTGWMYWSSGLLTMAGEVTAAALLMRWWLPGVPLWAFSLLFSLVVTGVNLMDTRGFSRVEGVFSGVKVGALALFVLVGIMLTTGIGPGGAAAIRTNLLGSGGFFPSGIRGVYGSLIIVIFAYAGMSVNSMAAANRGAPTDIPRAVISTGLITLVLYTSAVFVLVSLSPWTQIPTNSSPFVTVLDRIRVPAAGQLLNAIILSAVLSSMNTAMFGVTSMLQALAERGEAPKWLVKTNGRGIAVRAVLSTAAFLGVAVVLSYALPKQLFLYLASASSFISLFNWSTSALTYLRFRRTVKNRAYPFRLPGFPYLPYLSLGLLLAAMISIPLGAGQVSGLIVGAFLAVFFLAVYMILVRRRPVRSK